jgi:hypothetical protein
MRKPAETSNVTQFPQRQGSFPRRTLAPIPGQLTCLVLIRHSETARALLVSDNGDPFRSVWIPKSVLVIEKGERGDFLVATFPKLIAERKNLHPRFIDHSSGWTEAQLKHLCEAESLAARNRNRLRKHRDPLPYPGRNAFA